MRHFISLLDWNRDDIEALLDEAAQLKKEHQRGIRRPSLAGKVLGLVFEKPSLRTRVSFQAAMAQMGGSSVYLSGSEAGMGTRESIPDFAKVLSQYVDGVVLRTFAHGTVETFAAHAACPVINGLSDYHHPCQALADLFTVREVFGKLQGRTLVFVGDGNNVARSLAVGCGLLGLRFCLAAPNGYGFDGSFLETLHQQLPQAELLQNGSPAKVLREADVVYTDVWTSMGQEAESTKRRKAFSRYQVNQELIGQAPAHAVIMHCLPAHRGEEITNDVLDGDRSIVIQQAANRLHVQKALLQWLMGNEPVKARHAKSVHQLASAKHKSARLANGRRQ
jgi:ornithine carbamoyltransferase